MIVVIYKNNTLVDIVRLDPHKPAAIPKTGINFETAGKYIENFIRENIGDGFTYKIL